MENLLANFRKLELPEQEKVLQAMAVFSLLYAFRKANNPSPQIIDSPPTDLSHLVRHSVTKCLTVSLD